MVRWTVSSDRRQGLYPPEKQYQWQNYPAHQRQLLSSGWPRFVNFSRPAGGAGDPLGSSVGWGCATPWEGWSCYIGGEARQIQPPAHRPSDHPVFDIVDLCDL